jgi:uncharacterized protein
MGFASLIVKATRLCNLRCSYCHDWRVGRDQTMSFRVLAGVIAAALREPSHRSVEFIWHGGETTVLPISFYEKAIFLQARFRRPGQLIQNTIQTNGTRLTADWVHFLRSNEFAVGVSLDGPPSIHDVHRRYGSGRSSFSDVMAGIQLLKNADVPFTVLMVIDETALELGPDHIFDFFLAHDVRSYGLLAAKPDNQPHPVPGTAVAHYTPPAAINHFLARLYDRWLEHGDPEIKIRDLEAIRSRLRSSGDLMCVFGGGCIGHYFLVEPNGDVAHCDLFQGDDRYSLGNLLRDGFARLRCSENITAIKRENEQSLARLRACPEFPVCQGWCPHERYTAFRHDPLYREDCCGLRDLIVHVRSRLDSEPSRPPVLEV